MSERKFCEGTKERTVSQKMFYQEKTHTGYEILEMTAKVSGEKGEKLEKIAETAIEYFFNEARKELEKGDSEESPAELKC